MFTFLLKLTATKADEGILVDRGGAGDLGRTVWRSGRQERGKQQGRVYLD